MLTSLDERDLELDKALLVVEDYLLDAFERPLGRQYLLMLIGPPGVGKTEGIQEVCRRQNVALIPIRLTQYTANERDRARLLSRLPCRPGRIVIFFDELLASKEGLFLMILQLIDEGQLDTYRLPDGVVFLAAGNRKLDRASSQNLPANFQNRVTELRIKANQPKWKRAYAIPQGLHPTIVGYTSCCPENFAMDRVPPDGTPFYSPRSWTVLSHRLAYPNLSRDRRLLWTTTIGTVGEAAGGDYLAWCDDTEKPAASVVERVLAGSDPGPLSHDVAWRAAAELYGLCQREASVSQRLDPFLLAARAVDEELAAEIAEDFQSAIQQPDRATFAVTP